MTRAPPGRTPPPQAALKAVCLCSSDLLWVSLLHLIYVFWLFVPHEIPTVTIGSCTQLRSHLITCGKWVAAGPFRKRNILHLIVYEKCENYTAFIPASEKKTVVQHRSLPSGRWSPSRRTKPGSESDIHAFPPSSCASGDTYRSE